MTVTVRIPFPLRELCGGQSSCAASGGSLREIFSHLDQEFPGLKERLLEGPEELRSSVNVFLNDEDVRYLGGLDAPVRDGDKVWLVPAIAGGG